MLRKRYGSLSTLDMFCRLGAEFIACMPWNSSGQSLLQ
jgi:hypothetical protein